MRPIKFRAWDKGHKCMWKDAYPTDKKNILFSKINITKEVVRNNDGSGIPYPESIELEIPRPYISICSSGDYIWMQFTGHHDKNKKEIYEGDIVNVHMRFREEKWTVKAIVKWETWYGNVGFVLKAIKDSDSHMLYDEMGSNFSFKKDLEVIGNIHENPELIK